MKWLKLNLESLPTIAQEVDKVAQDYMGKLNNKSFQIQWSKFVMEIKQLKEI